MNTLTCCSRVNKLQYSRWDFFKFSSNSSEIEVFQWKSACKWVLPSYIISSVQWFQIVTISIQNKIDILGQRKSYESCFVFESGGIPPMRWIVNFDQDLLDGLVLAAQMAGYCPFLVRRFFNTVQGFCSSWMSVCLCLQCWGVQWGLALGCGSCRWSSGWWEPKERGLALTLCLRKVWGPGAQPGDQRDMAGWRIQQEHPRLGHTQAEVWKSPGFPAGSLLRGTSSRCSSVFAPRLNYFKDPDEWDSAVGNLGSRQ